MMILSRIIKEPFFLQVWFINYHFNYKSTVISVLVICIFYWIKLQIPYLDEWSTMMEEYSVSITEAIQALVNASERLPVGGNVRV